MSEQETVTVKLFKLTDGQALAYYADMLSMDADEKWEYCYENGLFWLDGYLWMLKDKVEVCDSDYIQVHKKTDSELEFTASWYNGGASFGEIVEEAFKKGVKS